LRHFFGLHRGSRCKHRIFRSIEGIGACPKLGSLEIHFDCTLVFCFQLPSAQLLIVSVQRPSGQSCSCSRARCGFRLGFICEEAPRTKGLVFDALSHIWSRTKGTCNKRIASSEKVEYSFSLVDEFVFDLCRNNG
jgi:hypothetical protein